VARAAVPERDAMTGTPVAGRLSAPAADAGSTRKVVDAETALSVIRAGDAVSFGGATLRRKPVGLAAAIGRSDVTGLRLQVWLGSFDVDVLVGTGRVAELDIAYTGFGPLGLPRATRRAVESGRVTVRNWSEASFVAAVRAAGQGLDFAVNRSLLGTSMADEIGTRIESPITGRPVVAVPALVADVAILHAQAADRWGNVYRERPNTTDDIDPLMASAARHVIVSVEEIVDTDDPRFSRDDVVIPGMWVDAVVESPRGAWPTACDGRYGVDLEAVQSYLDTSVTDEGVRDWVRAWGPGS
jgi:glutaconate CoA-transferase subunit A